MGKPHHFSPLPYRVEVFKGETDGIHLFMTGGTLRFKTMLLHTLSEGPPQGALLIAFQFRNIRWRWRRGRSQDLFQNPLTTQHGRSASGIRSEGQHAGLGQVPLEGG